MVNIRGQRSVPWQKFQGSHSHIHHINSIRQEFSKTNEIIRKLKDWF